MQSYDSLVRRVAAACRTPMATLAIVEHDRARFKASFGARCAEEVPLTFSLLAQTLASDDVFIVENTPADLRLAKSPVVIDGPRVRAYAGVPLVGPDGDVVGVLAVADRHPRAFGEEHLAMLRDFGDIASSLVFSSRELAMRRLMSRAVEEALDFVLAMDASTPAEGGPFIEYANGSLLHALGYTSSELIGQPCQMLFASNNDPAALQSIRENLERARDNEKEIKLLRKDGTTFWVEFTGRPMLDQSGSPSHWIAVGRDISSHRRALAQTAALVKALDSVTDRVEIYTNENGRYTLAFQNGVNDSHVSTAAEALLADSSVLEGLRRGDTVDANGISLRPLKEAETIICIHGKAIT
jgi:PAS domain S-box-containing protein